MFTDFAIFFKGRARSKGHFPKGDRGFHPREQRRRPNRWGSAESRDRFGEDDSRRRRLREGSGYADAFSSLNGVFVTQRRAAYNQDAPPPLPPPRSSRSGCDRRFSAADANAAARSSRESSGFGASGFGSRVFSRPPAPPPGSGSARGGFDKCTFCLPHGFPGDAPPPWEPDGLPPASAANGRGGGAPAPASAPRPSLRPPSPRA